jgi:hypothetical protein
MVDKRILYQITGRQQEGDYISEVDSEDEEPVEPENPDTAPPPQQLLLSSQSLPKRKSEFLSANRKSSVLGLQMSSSLA